MPEPESRKPGPPVTIENRLRGAIWGQFVGDAAALGTHWIYDLDELGRKFPGGVSGFEQPQEGHYHFPRQPGDQTHYGDGALVLLESIADRGRFEVKDFGRRFVETFQPGVYSGYVDRATKDTLENYSRFIEYNPKTEFNFQNGAEDDQLGTAARLASLVVRHCRDPDLLSLVESATRVSQNNPTAIACMKFNALLLLELFEGKEVPAAVRNVEEQVGLMELGPEVCKQSQAAREADQEEVVKATLAFGQSCPLEHSFPSAHQAFLKYSDDFETSILATIRAGGDSAGRAAMLGAWLGAHLGLAAIPEQWCRRLRYAERISIAVEKILRESRQ
jgi:ADP-ribosylglycohydrolase